MGLDLPTTCIGQKRHSGMQEMGETREAMAFDCWHDAQRLAERYSKEFNTDFWIMFAAKPHSMHSHAIVMGWEVCIKRPPSGLLGVMVFKWNHLDKKLDVETDLCLPYDIPLVDCELSNKESDFVTTIYENAKTTDIILAGR